MMRSIVHSTVAALLCITGTLSQAADFDGSKPLICAPVQAMDCVAGDTCMAGIPQDIGAPSFMRIDFEKNLVIGPKRASPVLFMDKSAEQILLQGTELGYAWTLALNSQGKMTVTLANPDGAFILFGSCTPP